MAANKSELVAVIGGGSVGVNCAIELRKAGLAVALVDPGDSGHDGSASYGNGGWLAPSSVVPEALPGMWRSVPSYLMDKRGPLTVRWRDFPVMLPWLIRFLAAGSTQQKTLHTSRALAAFTRDGPQLHDELSREAGLHNLIVRNGLMYIYRSREEFLHELPLWEIRTANDVGWREVPGHELKEREPDLHQRYGFAVLVPGGANCIDPGAYVHGLGNYAERLGVTRIRASVHGFEFAGDRLTGLATNVGSVACSRAVVCAGAHSGILARSLGDKVPLRSARGYHIQVPGVDFGPRTSQLVEDLKFGAARMKGGLRVSGQVEHASIDAPPNWNRAKLLFELAQETYPALAGHRFEQAQKWMGHRPAIVDGLPVIGFSRRSRDVIYGFGHGFIGLGTGPITGKLVTDLMVDRTPTIDPAPFLPARFH